MSRKSTPSWSKLILRRPLPVRHILADAALIVLSLYLSLWIRTGTENLFQHLDALHRFVPIFIGLRIVTFILMGVYFAMWRYISTHDAWRMARAVALSTLLFFAVSYVLPDWGRLPRSLFFIDALLCMGLLMGARLSRRALFERRFGHRKPEASAPRVPALIYGAGANGRALAQRLLGDPYPALEVLGFIDDDPAKSNRVIGGVPVLGNKGDLEALIENTGTRQLVVAISNPTGEFLREIVGIARRFNIQPQVINDFGASGGPPKKNMTLYRQVELSDLLNRQSAEIDASSVREFVRGRRVLITGAGGSIGSELSRQIFAHDPQRLILLDHSEYSLYEIDKELRLSACDTSRVVPLMIDIKDRDSLAHAIRTYQPDVVFHAAAYKHVHLVEANPYPAILNNVRGTQNLLELCEEVGVERFVLISTDKAVNPAGVMGATKRVCELLTSEVGRRTGKLYCSVRFGNVLGSSGSLIPLLRQQIMEGGPVTITHQDMTRYFMLIPEAVSLVLMASAISKPGDINVLRMGEPVKIVDIARSMIALMGHTEEEVPILFTGLRPGEKMFEELYLSGKELQTKHPDILTLPDGDLGLDASGSDNSALLTTVASMVSKARAGDKEALVLLTRLVKSNYLELVSEDQEGTITPKLLGQFGLQ